LESNVDKIRAARRTARANRFKHTGIGDEDPGPFSTNTLHGEPGGNGIYAGSYFVDSNSKRFPLVELVWPLEETDKGQGYDADDGTPPLSSPFRFDPILPQYTEAGFHPPTSPSTPTLPSLEAIRAGLWSSSASSEEQRAIVAITKPTGETYEPVPLVFVNLTRNNAVAGGERMAARERLLHRLGKRRNTDVEQTSASEGVTQETTNPAKQKHRRERTIIVDDREPSSTTPTTPVLPNSPSTHPVNPDQLAEALVPDTTDPGAVPCE